MCVYERKCKFEKREKQEMMTKNTSKDKEGMRERERESVCVC